VQTGRLNRPAQPLSDTTLRPLSGFSRCLGRFRTFDQGALAHIRYFDRLIFDTNRRLRSHSFQHLLHFRTSSRESPDRLNRPVLPFFYPIGPHPPRSSRSPCHSCTFYPVAPAHMSHPARPPFDTNTRPHLHSSQCPCRLRTLSRDTPGPLNCPA